MNTLIAFFALLAVAAAGNVGLGYAGLGYSGLGYSGLGYNGLGYNGLGYNGLGYAGPYAHGYAGSYAHAAPLAYANAHHGVALASEPRLIDPVAIAAGAPLPTGDTVEVAAAKAAHLHAHAVETSRNIHAYSHAAPLAYAHHAAPVAHAYAHAAPLAYAHHANPIAAYGHHGIALASEARQIDPVAIAAGAPLPTGDTIEVAAAKAAHLHAHAVETARTGHHLLYKRGLGYAAPLAYAYAPRAVAYQAPLVSAPHPVPVHHHIAYAAPVHHALSYSAVASHHVSHPYAYGHHY